MSSLETRVSRSILRLLRSRREGFAGSTGAQVSTSAGHGTAKLREADLTDFPAVSELKRRGNMAPDSFENWQRLWSWNPALAKLPFPRPIGWVLESATGIVGYLGNISLCYHYGKKALTAVAGTGLVVDPAYRAVSMSLSAAFYRQKNVDLYLTTTAVEATGRIARAFKCDPLPQADYEAVLFWVLQPYPFAQALTRKLKLPPAAAHFGSILGMLGVGTDKFCRRRWPKHPRSRFSITEIAVGEIGSVFDGLWKEKLEEEPRLLADRDAETLRWHFATSEADGSTRVLCCYAAGDLLGYAVVRNEAPDPIHGLRRSLLADMLAKHDDPEVFGALWAAAYDLAKAAGSHTFEVLGFPKAVREVSSDWGPYVRRYPNRPFHYKASEASLHSQLSQAKAWYACPFDGDTTL